MTLNLTGHSGFLPFSGISTILIENLLFNFCKQRINVSSQKVKRLLINVVMSPIIGVAGAPFKFHEGSTIDGLLFM